MTKEEELGLNKRKKKFDIREEYYVRFDVILCIESTDFRIEQQRLQAMKSDDWEQKRVERPKGTPDWGVPPTELPPRS